VDDIDRFVVEANIARFRMLLKARLAPATRETVRALLAEAEADLRKLDRSPRDAAWQGCIATVAWLATALAQAA
jgi:hypothetical protein